MSTYDDASLIMFPSGYKEDKIYSLKPTDGSGDLTFTRASTATRVNSDGLIETASVLGSEEITNGDFDGNANNWTLDSGVTYGDNNLVFATDSNQKATQTQTFTVGKTYRVSIELVAYTSGIITVRMGSVPQVITTDIGVKTWDIIATGNLARIEGTFGIGVSATIDNVSVKEVITNNVPRIDYTGGGCGKLLLEPQRTNLFTYSSEFDNAAWTLSRTSAFGSGSVVNAAISPDGTQNAEYIQQQAGQTNSGGVFLLYTMTVGVTYTLSVYAKRKEQNAMRIGAAAGVAGLGLFASFDLVNGVIGNVSSGLTTKIEDYGNGWYRCSVTFTKVDATGNALFLYQTDSPTSTTAVPLDGVYIWGAQLEAGSYSTSLIPTTSTAVTRLADAASKTGISSLIGQTEGVMFLDFVLSQNEFSVGTNISLNDGTASNRIIIGKSSSSNKLNTFIQKTTGQGSIVTSFDAIVGQRYKCAISYKLNDIKFYVNGVLIGVDTVAEIPLCSKISFDSADGSSPFYGNFQNIILFKTALTNAELATLTTL